jgi:hypothetical protein
MQVRFPRIAMMARDVFSIQAAGVGVEREFSIAGQFNLDNRTYSSAILGALMICNHTQFEENVAIGDSFAIDYYSVDLCSDNLLLDEAEKDIERKEAELQLGTLIQSLKIIDISDGEDESDDELDGEQDQGMYFLRF